MALTVRIKREPFSDTFDLEMPNGHTETLEPDELRDWFAERGGDVEKLDPVLDSCWNFPRWHVVTIVNVRPPRRTSLDPKLDIDLG